MYERHCILIWAHNARVPAARHMRLTRLTGPTSIPVQTEMRATHFARVLSQLAHRAQLAYLDTRTCTCRHSSIVSTSEKQVIIWKHGTRQRQLQAGMQMNLGGNGQCTI